MRHDIVRVGLSVLLLATLAWWGLPFWLFLTLPLLTYIGLWLLVAAPEIMPPDPPRIPVAGVGAAYRRCVELRSHIAELSDRIEDAGVRGQLQSVTTCVDKSLEVISEDGKDDAALPLSELLQLTDELLSRYMKVVRRGVAKPAHHVELCERLATIERACHRFWVRLNRDAVVDFRALSETIEVLLDDAGRPSEDGDFMPIPPSATLTEPPVTDQPSPQPGTATSAPPSATATAAGPGDAFLRLTTREREILCLLPSGKTDHEIADERFISPRTVSKHIEAIYAKLGVRNRAEAVAFAVRHGVCGDGRAEDALADH